VRNRHYGATHTRIDQIIDIDQSDEEDLNKNYVSASKSASTLLGGCDIVCDDEVQNGWRESSVLGAQNFGGFDTTVRVDS